MNSLPMNRTLIALSVVVSMAGSTLWMSGLASARVPSHPVVSEKYAASEVHLAAQMYPRQVVGKPALLHIIAAASHRIDLILQFAGTRSWSVQFSQIGRGICEGTDDPARTLALTHDTAVIDFAALSTVACSVSIGIVPKALGRHSLTIQAFKASAYPVRSLRQATGVRGAIVHLSSTVTAQPWGAPPRPTPAQSFRAYVSAAVGAPSPGVPFPLHVHVGYKNGWVRHLIIQLHASSISVNRIDGTPMCGAPGVSIGSSAWDFGAAPERGGCDTTIVLNPFRGHYDLRIQAYASNDPRQTFVDRTGSTHSPVLRLRGATPVPGSQFHLSFSV